MVTIGSAHFALFHRALQAHLLHQPLDPLVIHPPALPTQQHCQTAIAVGRIHCRQRRQCFPQRVLVLLWLSMVKRAAR